MAVTTDRIREVARELGFTACGFASLQASQRGDALDRWLTAGYAGTMRYLHRQARRRKAPADIVPGARSAVVVLENYLPPGPEPEGPRRIARYARGRDYHLAMGERLDQLADWLRTEGGAAIARPFVDAGPVPERELAHRAGLGWIGKNTMLIRPGAGSWTLIGSVFTDLDLGSDAPVVTDHCGSCTRCLEACPTAAFPAPGVLDATRCISYLTIEFRGPLPGEFLPLPGGWAFGCDICNEVCPWNLKFAEPTDHADYAPRPLQVDDDGLFDRLDEAGFRDRFGDTPLERPGLEGMRRNWHAAGPATR